MSFQYMESFEYEQRITNGQYVFALKKSKQESDDLYAFYLYRNGENIHKTDYSRNSTFEFSLESQGEYHINCFIKNNTGISIFNYDPIPYFYFNPEVVGPSALVELGRNVGIIKKDAIQDDSNIVLLDLIEIAIAYVEKFSQLEGGDENALSLLRDEVRNAFNSFHNSTMFLVRWSLYSDNLYLNQVNWLLEECYDVCRRHAVRLHEMPVIYAKDFSCLDDENLAKKLYSCYSNQLVQSLKKVVYDVKTADLDDMSVEIALHETVLSAKIQVAQANPENRYCFYLCRDGQVVEKTHWFKENSFHCNLEKNGVYFVQATVKRGSKKVIYNSETVEFFTKELQQEFKEFLQNGCKEKIDGISTSLQFVSTTAPNCDICIVSSKKVQNINDAPELTNTFCTACSKIGEWYFNIYSNQDTLHLQNGEQILLSGSIFLYDKICFGMSDLERVTRGEELKDQRGFYSYLSWNNEKLDLGADHFSFQHWYFYQTSDVLVVANSYHMLLLFLKDLQIPLELDIKKACVTLSTSSVQLLMQNFSRRMDIKQVYQLTGDQTLRLSNEGWIFVSTALGKLLNEKIVYHEKDYRKLLFEAKEELISSIQPILEDQRFSNIIVDLSGGLDSRVVFSALTCAVHNKQKVRINTKDVAGSKDLTIAASVNDIYRYQYDDLPEVRKHLSLSESDQRTRSYLLGTYYSHNLLGHIVSDRKNLQLIGACGEILARPYISRKYLGTPLEQIKDPREFAQYLYRDYSPNLLLGGAEYFPDYFGEELSNIPVDCLTKALDTQYMLYRHGYHFNASFLLQGCQIWAPMQLKTMMRLYHMSVPVLKSIKPQLDLLSILNPVVYSIPFDSERDNQDRKALSKQIVYEDERFHSINIHPPADLTVWKNAQERKAQSVSYLNQSDPRYQDIDLIIYAALCRNFRRLMVLQPALSEQAGVAIYHYILRVQNNKKAVRFFYNKITSLLDQCEIAQKPNAPKKDELNSKKLPQTISIFGSCVSRDLLEFDTLRYVQLKIYIARQSLLSATSSPISEDVISVKMGSLFRKRAVEMDLNKQAFMILSADPSEYLMIDLIDERFPLVSIEGNLATASNEFYEATGEDFLKAGPLKKSVKGNLLYLEDALAEDAICSFCNNVLEIYRPNQIILHQAKMVNQYEASDGTIKDFPDHQLNYNKTFNSILDVMYLRMRRYLRGSHIIDEMQGALATESHKWGLAPMHYHDAYYHRVIKRLMEIVN